MYNHMVGRTASVVSPFYSLLPGSLTLCTEYINFMIVCICTQSFITSLSCSARRKVRI